MAEARLTPRQQGDLGELSAMQWLVNRGAHIYLPVGQSPDFDLIAELDGSLVRVEVKTSASRSPHGRWCVAVATRGGNQSWSGLVKRFTPDRCDYLFAHVGDGRRWFIPADEVEGTSTIHLGGTKYAQFEVEPAQPLPLGPAAPLESAAARGSTEAVKRVAL